MAWRVDLPTHFGKFGVACHRQRPAAVRITVSDGSTSTGMAVIQPWEIIMRRREFIVGLGGAAAWPLAARAQQPDRMRRVGYLTGSSESNPVGQATIAAFQLELGRLGWVDGRNVRIDHRFAASRGDEGRCGRQAHVLGQPRRSDGTRGMSALPLIAARCRTAIGGAPIEKTAVVARSTLRFRIA